MADDPNSPSFLSGLMSGLNGLGSNPLFNVGMGLMSAAKPFGNVGDSMMQANQATAKNQLAQQQLGMGNLQMAQAQREFPLRMKWLQAAMNNMPQGSGTAQSGGMMDPTSAVNMGLSGAMLGMPGASDYLKVPEITSALQAYKIKQAQLAVQPQLAVLDSVATAPNAHTLVDNIPGLKDQWTAVAPQLGIDPKDPASLTPQNARNFATFRYNQLAGNAGLDPKPMPQPLVTTRGPNGQQQQTNPVSGKTDVSVPAQPLTAIADPKTGAPVLAPSGQAAGKSPFNEQIFAANQISPETLEQNYQTWKATGKPPANASRNVLANATQANYIAKRAQEDNISNPGKLAAAQQQAYEAQQGVIKDFTNPDGKAGASLVAINTAVAHIRGLDPLIDAMQSGNLTRINQARQAYQKEFGIPAPTNYQALATMASAEASKAVFAGGGGEAERDQIAAPFKASGGPDVLHGAVQTVSTALAGKTEALRNAWDVGTNGTQGSFDRFLMPATRQALGIPNQDAQLPLKNAQGWVLHKDPKGNMAYVSPDGKQFVEAK